MSTRKELYTSITAKLKELGIYEWIDLDKAQMSTPKESYPFGFPAAFIRIQSIKYEDMVLDMQEGFTSIDILIFFNKYGDTFDGATDQADSLDILDNIDTTTQKIQWLEGANFTQLTSTKEEDLTERYKRPAYKLTFSTIINKDLKTDNYVSNN